MDIELENLEEVQSISLDNCLTNLERLCASSVTVGGAASCCVFCRSTVLSPVGDNNPIVTKLQLAHDLPSTELLRGAVGELAEEVAVVPCKSFGSA